MPAQHTKKRFWTLVLATLSVLPFLLFALYSIVQLMQSKQQDLQQQLIDRTQATANAVAERLSVSTAALRALASSDAAARGDLAAMYAQSKRVLQGLPDISALSLVNQDGEVQFLTLLPLGAKTFLAGDREAVLRVFETGKPMVSEPFRSPVDKDVIITSIGVPVLREGKVVYCLRAIFRTSSLNNLLAAQRMPPDWVSAILSRTGLLQARSRAAEKFVGKPASEAVLQAMANQTTGVFDGTTKEGIRTKSVISPVPGWDWQVVVGVPAEQFDGPLQRVILFLGLFGMATLVLGAMAMGWLMFYRKSTAKAPAQPGAQEASNTVGVIWPSAVALLVALAMGAATTLAAQQASEQIRDLAERRQTIFQQSRKIVELLSAYKDIEAAQRGFVTTGEESYLASYRDSLPRISLLTSALKARMEQSADSSFNWVDLAHLSTLRLARAADDIARRKQLGPGAAVRPDWFEQSALLSDKLGAMLGNLDAQLDAQVQRINTSIAAQELKTRQLQWVSQIAIGALVLLSVGIWLNERRRRQAAIDQLRLANETLEERVAKRTMELALASQRIAESALETETLIDKERRRLSREVHDQIGQIFTGLKMIARTLKPGSLADDQHQAMMGAIESGVKISRRIAAELRPPLLDDFGLRTALDHYLKTTFNPLGIAVDLQFPEQTRLSAQQKSQLFRMVQEACTNVIRHAQASQVMVSADNLPDGLQVRIEDDGIGFEQVRVRDGALGLTGMQERAKLSGAALTVQTRAAGGTCITLDFPANALLSEFAA